MLFRLALRNIQRQKRRTILTLSILASGFMALSLAGGFMSQTFQGLADSAIRGGLGHVQVLHEKALSQDEGQSLEFAVSEGEKLASKLRNMEGVADVLPRIQFMGLISSGGQSVVFLGSGVDPTREARFMAVQTQIEDGRKTPGGEQGRYISSDSQKREVVLGIGLARALGVSVGDSVTLMATTRDAALNGMDLEVAGFQDVGLKELNDRSLSVSLATATELLDAGESRSRLSVFLKDPSQAEAVALSLQSALPKELKAKPWFELASFYQQVKMLYIAIFGFMGLVLSLVVLLATANTLLMSVMERMRELGTLRALGLKPRQMLTLLQWEGAILGFAGSALGLVLTLLLRASLNALHIQMPAPPGTSHGYELNIHFVPAVYALSFVILQAVIQFSALFPGLKAAKLRITEALRHL